MLQPHELDLFDYLLGTASPELQAHIAQSPEAQQAAHALAKQLAALYRVTCPQVPVLVAYQEGRIGDHNLAQQLTEHVSSCSHCPAELAMLYAIDDILNKSTD